MASSAHRRRHPIAALALVGALVLAGCSSDGSDGAADGTTTTGPRATTTTARPTAATTTEGPGGTTTTTPPGDPSTTVPDSTPDTTPGTTAPTDGPTPDAPLTSAEVEAQIRARGDWDPDMSTYAPEAELYAIEAVASGAASSAAPEQVFFISQDGLLGTATSTPRAGLSIESATGDAVTVRYSHWAPTDPFCCPSLEPWVVTFRLVDGKVTPSGELPPEDQGL